MSESRGCILGYNIVEDNTVTEIRMPKAVIEIIAAEMSQLKQEIMARWKKMPEGNEINNTEVSFLLDVIVGSTIHKCGATMSIDSIKKTKADYIKEMLNQIEYQLKKVVPKMLEAEGIGGEDNGKND